MSNIEENSYDGVTLIDKTIRDIEDNSTALIIPEFAKALSIENFKVSISY